MDPDVTGMDAVDHQAGGDNPLSNPVTSTTASAPPPPSTTQADLAQDNKSAGLDSGPPETVGGDIDVSGAPTGITAATTLDPSLNRDSSWEAQIPDAETVDGDVEEGVGLVEPPENGSSPDTSPSQKEVASGRQDVPDDASNINVSSRQAAVAGGEDRREGEEDVDGKMDSGGDREPATYDAVDGRGEEEAEEDREGSGGEQGGARGGGGASQAQEDQDSVHVRRRQRSDLFKEGLKLQEAEGGADGALACFLGAITGLTEAEAFPELPQCLHQISDIYSEKKEYEKAVYFIQAEKMYYETALIDHVNIQKQLESMDGRGEEGTESVQKTAPTEESDSLEVVKAKEFEKLAKLCLKESKPQLALDYCGKATQIFRNVYGDDHPTTIGSLDLFTMIYADVGKKLYTDAMQKYDSEDKEPKESTEQPEVESGKGVAGEESTSDLRQRSKSTDPRQIRAQTATEPRGPAGVELEPAPRPDEQDDWVTTCLLMLLFLLVTFLILLLVAYFYCLGNERSSICHQFKGDLSYWYMKIKHYYLGL